MHPLPALFSVLLLAPLASLTASATNSKPNIVFILADDLGWGDLGCYGHPYARTPNLDKLAAEGTRFTQFYATGVTCCPARTGLMTGRFPASFQKYPASFGFGDRVTVTELLKKSGYATGHFGKWHIGTETAPGTYGIDEIGVGEGGKRKLPADQGRDAAIFDQAIRFIEQHRQGPFYLNVWGHITHHPVNPSAALVSEFTNLQVDEAKFSEAQRQKFEMVRKAGSEVNDAMRRFLADLYSLDRDVGRLLARLDELGLRENTLVVFSSDQGAGSPREPGESKPKRDKDKPGAEDREALRLNLMGYAGPDFCGGKHEQLEGGVRVPWIMRWPGKVPAGRVDSHSVLSGADWLPSLCAVTGVKINTADFDGEDSSQAWFGGSHRRSKPLFWKTNTEHSTPSMRWEHWKFHAPSRRRAEAELYDLRTDPGEKNNLADQQPNVVKELTAKMESWLATLPKTYEKGVARDD